MATCSMKIRFEGDVERLQALVGEYYAERRGHFRPRVSHDPDDPKKKVLTVDVQGQVEEASFLSTRESLLHHLDAVMA